MRKLAAVAFALVLLGAASALVVESRDFSGWPGDYKAYPLPKYMYGSYYYLDEPGSNYGNTYQYYGGSDGCGSYYYSNGRRYCDGYGHTVYRSPNYNVYYALPGENQVETQNIVYLRGPNYASDYVSPTANAQTVVYQTIVSPNNYGYNYPTAPTPSCGNNCGSVWSQPQQTAPAGSWMNGPNYWYYSPYEGYSR